MLFLPASRGEVGGGAVWSRLGGEGNAWHPPALRLGCWWLFALMSSISCCIPLTFLFLPPSPPFPLCLPPMTYSQPSDIFVREILIVTICCSPKHLFYARSPLCSLLCLGLWKSKPRRLLTYLPVPSLA